MTQDAIVTKVLPDGMAEVVVTRATACGSNCGNCESCIYQNELKTLAHNKAGAVQGQKVVIESITSKIFGAALLVYIMPLVLFLLGYVLADALGCKEIVCVAVSFAFLIIGAIILVASQRLKKNKNSISYDIVQIVGEGEI